MLKFHNFWHGFRSKRALISCVDQLWLHISHNQPNQSRVSNESPVWTAENTVTVASLHRALHRGASHLFWLEIVEDNRGHNTLPTEDQQLQAPMGLSRILGIFASSNFHILFMTWPAVPHKAVAEVSIWKTCRRGWLLWIMDGRANPLMDRKVVGVSGYPVFLSVYLSFYLFICLSISLYLSVYLSVYPSVCLSVYLSVYVSVYLSVSLQVDPGQAGWQKFPGLRSVALSVSLWVYLSVCLSIYLSIYLSSFLALYFLTCLSFYLFIYLYLSIYLSI